MNPAVLFSHARKERGICTSCFLEYVEISRVQIPLFYVVRCYEYRGIRRIGNLAVHSRKKILYLTLRYRFL